MVAFITTLWILGLETTECLTKWIRYGLRQGSTNSKLRGRNLSKTSLHKMLTSFKLSNGIGDKTANESETKTFIS